MNRERLDGLRCGFAVFGSHEWRSPGCASRRSGARKTDLGAWGARVNTSEQA